MRKPQAGFTLVELLVVIAIIGILASIVLGALGTSRQKGSDAAIKETFHQLADQIELYALANGDYGPPFSFQLCVGNPSPSMFSTDSKIVELIVSLNATNGGNTICAVGNSNGGNSSNSWAIASPLSTSVGNTNWWCVDSSGMSKISYVPTDPLVNFLSYFIPIAHARVTPGIVLGGGNLGAAFCP